MRRIAGWGWIAALLLLPALSRAGMLTPPPVFAAPSAAAVEAAGSEGTAGVSGTSGGGSAGSSAPPPVADGDVSEETRRLLEKSLSVVEIDREIDRIAGQRVAAQAGIDKTQQRLAAQEIAIAAQREKAGRVLRSYYMGQRDMLWSALLNFRSLPELLQTWEMIDLIFESDHRALDGYTAAYRQLQKDYDTLQKNKAELASVETELRAQRDRVVKLQQELDRALSSSGQSEKLRQMMEETQAYWRNVGIYEVRNNFDALADAMNNLPAYIEKHPEMLKTSGLKMTLTLTDTELNDYLRSQNKQLSQFAIAFEPGVMKLEGSDGVIRVGIEGHYTVENEPKNAILFHIDKLIFNGLELPDTTRADLERQFDLGFYPGDMLKYIKADTVGLEQGQLIVGLRIGK